MDKWKKVERMIPIVSFGLVGIFSYILGTLFFLSDDNIIGILFNINGSLMLISMVLMGICFELRGSNV